MADEPDANEKPDEATTADVEEGEHTGWRHRVGRWKLSRVGTALVASAVIVATLTGLTGWLGYHAYQTHRAEWQRNLFVQVARQGAVNLTTINFTQVDADVQRI